MKMRGQSLQSVLNFSPEKALLYANLSPVPSLYSATCPLLQYYSDELTCPMRQC